MLGVQKLLKWNLLPLRVFKVDEAARGKPGLAGTG